MEHLSGVLQGVAAVLWAVFAFVALLVFATNIKNALGRVRKGKLLGQEFELGEDLVKLELAATAAKNETSSLPFRASEIEIEQDSDTSKRILLEAAKSPLVALIMLGRELESRAMRALVMRGLLEARSRVPVRQALSELQRYGFPSNLIGSLRLFEDVRNQIVHGTGASEQDTLRAIDSGLTILNAINMLPVETNVVYHPGVEIYSDQNCTVVIPGARGVILETTSPGGAIKTFRIYPSTRTHFRKGVAVGWEWNMLQVWADAWYRDPDTGEVKLAWNSSAEFVGRNLED